MAFRGRKQANFGSKQPSKISQVAAFKTLLCGARSLDALPAISQLANMYRLDPKTVEYEIGVERRRRSETGAA